MLSREEEQTADSYPPTNEGIILHENSLTIGKGGATETKARLG